MPSTVLLWSWSNVSRLVNNYQITQDRYKFFTRWLQDMDDFLTLDSWSLACLPCSMFSPRVMPSPVVSQIPIAVWLSFPIPTSATLTSGFLVHFGVRGRNRTSVMVGSVRRGFGLERHHAAVKGRASVGGIQSRCRRSMA